MQHAPNRANKPCGFKAATIVVCSKFTVVAKNDNPFVRGSASTAAHNGKSATVIVGEPIATTTAVSVCARELIHSFIHSMNDCGKSLTPVTALTKKSADAASSSASAENFGCSNSAKL